MNKAWEHFKTIIPIQRLAEPVSGLHASLPWKEISGKPHESVSIPRRSVLLCRIRRERLVSGNLCARPHHCAVRHKGCACGDGKSRQVVWASVSLIILRPYPKLRRAVFRQIMEKPLSVKPYTKASFAGGRENFPLHTQKNFKTVTVLFLSHRIWYERKRR